MIQVDYGFLELPFLTTPFLTQTSEAVNGMQVTKEITTEDPVGLQVQREVTIEDPVGMEVNRSIDETEVPTGLQVLRQITTETPTGLQVLKEITTETPVGFQVNRLILDLLSPNGMEYTIRPWQHRICPVFLVDPFLTTSFLAQRICVVPGMQVLRRITTETPTGFQVLRRIDAEVPIGMQILRQIDAEVPVGMQVLKVLAARVGMQVAISLYNATQLRVLCEFASRGASTTGGGNNLWGNPIGTGQNWSASSTASGDYGANRLNTDITDEKWRSAGIGSVLLRNDSEITQGILIDTLGLLNHNLTSSAIVTLAGTNDPTFVSTPLVINLQATADNIYYIAPTQPFDKYRYWQLTIDDPTNPDGYYEIGTIVWGNSDIFPLTQNFTDLVDFGFKDFVDSVETEGFTDMENSRALRKHLSLDFRSLDSRLGAFDILRSVFTTYRTTHKCLWIPTPDPVDMENTALFAMFSKLVEIPRETHNAINGSALRYIDLRINLDESK